MKSANSLLTLPIVIALSISACNINVQPPPTSLSHAAASIVAATLKAQSLPTSTGSAATPSASPVASTPTVKPTLHINTDNAKCRSGPGPDFKVIASFTAGTTVDLLGKDTADSYWLVNDPTGGGLCWVQSQDATPGGSFGALPEGHTSGNRACPASAPGKPHL